MKVPVPSPAMAVALLALVVASTGTAVATTAMINGSQIKPHSITSKQLKKGAVDSKALGKGSVGSNALAPASVTSVNLLGPLPPSKVSQTCPDGTVVVGKPCPVGTFEDVAGAAVSNEAAIPAAGGVQTLYHPGGQGPATFAVRVAKSPLAPMRFSKLTAEIVVDPAVKWPSFVIVQLLRQGSGTPVAACAINSPAPGADNSCAMAVGQSIDMPGLSKYTFAIAVGRTGADPTWDAFSVGYSYISSQTCKLDTCP